MGVASVAILTACASQLPNQKDAAKNNQVTYRKDLQVCKEDYPQQSSGPYFRQWEGCVSLKGWK